MSTYERQKIAEKLKLNAFSAKNFGKPYVYKKLDQIKFYSSALCKQITKHESKFSIGSVGINGLPHNNVLQNSLREIRNKKNSH